MGWDRRDAEGNTKVSKSLISFNFSNSDGTKFIEEGYHVLLFKFRELSPELRKTLVNEAQCLLTGFLITMVCLANSIHFFFQ